VNWFPRIPTLAATALGLVPAISWACSAGVGQVFTWRGLAMFAGFSAVGLLAVSMLLMLRLTLLDRVFGGLGHMYRAHHSLGVAAFLFLLTHPLALALNVTSVHASEALRLLWPNPSSAVVFSGWVALLLFAVFFVVSVISTVSFDRWRQIHRASGFAYGIMAWHLVAVGSGSVAAGLALGLMIAGALAYAHRVLVQDPPWLGLRYNVVEVHHRGPNIVDLVLEPQAVPLRFEAGQFAYLALRDSPNYRACGELHPYTMTGRPDDRQLHLSIKALGDCTRHIQELTPGTEAIIRGPFGGLFPAKVQTTPQVWIGGGIGVTPFLSRAASLAPGGPPIDIVYAAASESAALYLAELRALSQAHPNMRVHALFEDVDGRPTVSAIEARTGSLEGKQVMLAGPPAMVRALRRELRRHGVSEANIHSEEGTLQ
jgi:predicted ferric reductase